MFGLLKVKKRIINVNPNNRFFCRFHKNLSQFLLSFSFYMLSYLNAYILNGLHVFTKLPLSIYHSCLSSQTIWLHFILINKKSTEVTNDLTYLPILFLSSASLMLDIIRHHLLDFIFINIVHFFSFPIWCLWKPFLKRGSPISLKHEWMLSSEVHLHFFSLSALFLSSQQFPQSHPNHVCLWLSQCNSQPNISYWLQLVITQISCQ